MCAMDNPLHTLFSIQSLQALAEVGQPDGTFLRSGRPYCYTILAIGAGAESSLADTGIDSLALYFISPGQLAAPALVAQGQGRAILFSDEFFCLTGEEKDLLLQCGLFNAEPQMNYLVINQVQHSAMFSLLRQLQDEFAHSGPGLLRESMLRVLLKAFLIYCLRVKQEQHGQVSNPEQPSLYTRFRNLLEGQFTVAKSVREYALQLNVTANHLSESIKKETGLPARDHISRRIALEAQRLAYFSNLSLKEISFRLGFKDVAHFSKFFKRCNGISFLQFKERMRQGMEAVAEVVSEAEPR
jgi:AraC family transcriptional activator of pobA